MFFYIFNERAFITDFSAFWAEEARIPLFSENGELFDPNGMFLLQSISQNSLSTLIIIVRNYLNEKTSNSPLSFTFLPDQHLSVAQEKMDKATSHTMKGYLVDKMCAIGMAKKAPDEAMAKAAKHTKSCALEESCQESGFGLMSDGIWYKFDDNGDKQALALLNKTEKKTEIMVAVTGTHDGDILKVTSIKEVKSLGPKKE